MDFEVIDFKQEVLDRSHEIPVLVDFWAEWCAPCKVVGPILERLAAKNAGKWVLKKLNTEAHQDIALGYKIGSIPNVKLFVDGVVVDEFLGSLPEDLIVKWLKAAIPGNFDSQISESLDLLKSGRAAEAAIVLESVLEVESENIQAKVMLGRAVVFTDPIRAESLCRGLLPESEFYETAQMVIQCAGLFKKKASPGLLLEAPVKARYLDAIESLANQDFNAALEKMIGVMAENRAYDNDGARKACVAIFHCLGEEHEITKRHRHAFGMVLNV